MLGETLALLAALNWAVSIILFRKSEHFTPQGINLFKNVMALVLLLLSMLVLGVSFDTERSSLDFWRLSLSGGLGIALADTLIFVALRRLGAALYGVVNCAYAPTLVALSVIFLGEPVGSAFLLGGSLVVGGVLLVATEKLDQQTEAARHPQLLGGILLCLVAIFAMAAGVILAKPALESSHLVEATAVRMAGGVAVQLVWIAAVPSQRAALQVFKPNPVWKTLVPGSFLGSYVAMLLWLGGFKWAAASVAAVLNQLASVFTIILARVILKEALTPRRMLGGLIAIAGAIWIVAKR